MTSLRLREAQYVCQRCCSEVKRKPGLSEINFQKSVFHPGLFNSLSLSVSLLVLQVRSDLTYGNSVSRGSKELEHRCVEHDRNFETDFLF